MHPGGLPGGVRRRRGPTAPLTRLSTRVQMQDSHRMEPTTPPSPSICLSAEFPHPFVIVLGGRQPTGVLCLVLQKFRSKSNLQFLTWWSTRACLKNVNMSNQRVFCPLDGAIFPCNPPGFLRKNCLPEAQNPPLLDTSPIFKQALLLNAENFFDGNAEDLRDVPGQHQGGIIPALFQVSDGLPADAHKSGQILLLHIMPGAVLLDFIPNHAPAPSAPEIHNRRWRGHRPRQRPPTRT